MNAPTREDPVARALSEVIGGPSGDHARPHPWWTPVRVLLAVFTVAFALAVVQKQPCVATDWSNQTVRYSKMCYSDIPYLYTGRGFAEHRWPYSDSGGRYDVMEYPVLTSYLAWAAAEVTAITARWFSSGPSQAVRAATQPGQLWSLPGMVDEVDTYVAVTAILLFCLGIGAVLFLAGASPGRPWDAMAFVLSPVLVVSALVNWDLLAVFFTAGALWAWARGKPLLAGIMIGLGVAAKLYPLFLLGALLIDIWRRRRFDLAVPVLVGAVASWLLVNLPAMITGMSQWKVFWRFNNERGADLGSLWLVLSQQGTPVSASTINVVSAVLFALACLGILLLGLAAPARPRVAQTAFLIVAAFLLVNKVYSPQYVLWLLPLAVLARPRWRDLLIWQAGELIYFAAVWIYLGGWLAPSAGETPTAYHLAILVRVAAQLWLVAMVVRDIWTAPESADLDGVDRGGGEADPDLDLLADRRRLHA